MLEEETAKQHEEQGNLTLNVRLRLNAAIKITGRVRYSVTLRDKTEIPLVLAAQPSIHVESKQFCLSGSFSTSLM